MRTNVKKIFAVLLTVALVTTMFVMPANATKTYGDFLEDSVVNGDFEVGVEGMTPYGWEVVYLDNTAALNPGADYSRAVKFSTAVENGNKVLYNQKVGGGYAYVQSQPIDVVGGQRYVFSFDYKVFDIVVPEGQEAHWHGVYPKYREYDAEGNVLNSNGELATNLNVLQKLNSVAPTEDMTDYKTYQQGIKLNANTAKVVFYLGVHATNMTVTANAYFDNVSLKLDTDPVYPSQYEVYNASFDEFSYKADGGKAEGLAGPAGWTTIGREANGATENAGYAKRYEATIGTETDANGKLNNYLQFTWAKGYRGIDVVRGYATVTSNKIHCPWVSNSVKTTFTLSFKVKTTYTGDAFSACKVWQPWVGVLYYTSDDTFISSQTKGLGKQTEIPDWTEYTLSCTAPANAAYARIAFYLGGNKVQDAELNAVYCLDDVKVNYATRFIPDTLDGYYKESAQNNGQQNSTNWYNSAHTMSVVNDATRGEVLMVTGSDTARASSNKGAEGYIAFWNKTLIPVVAGKTLTISYDAMEKGWDLVTGTKNGNLQNASIRVRYYDANGNKLSDGTKVLLDTIRIGSSQDNYDWKSWSEDKTVPANAVYAEWGIFSMKQNIAGTSMIEQYYDNIAIIQDGVNMLDTNLFNKVLLAGGNANGDSSINLADLVNMNNKIAEGTYSDGADMNKNGKIDAEDITLLRWKLLGIDSEEYISSGVITKNPLEGKTMLFCGDSIMAETNDNNYKPWSYKVAEATGAVSTNAALGGSRFAGHSDHNRDIVNQIFDNARNFDYLIFNGGVNDTNKSNTTLGEISASYDINDFDRSTIAGAMEAACYYAHTLYPNAKIGFIVTYRNSSDTYHDNTFNTAKAICEKWNIPYIDLYDGTVIVNGEELSYSYDILDINNRESHFAHPEITTDVHIAESGYEVTAPYILDWIYTLTDNVSPIPAK